MTIAIQLHRGLFRYTPQGEVEKDLAESWEERDDGKTFRVKLRDAKFSTGENITAHHVVQSFARLFSVGSLMAADLSYFEGHETIRSNPSLSQFGVLALNKKEVEFRLKFPAGLFLKHLAAADCAILQVKDFRDPLTFSEKQGYSGPYLVHQIDSRAATLEKWRVDVRETRNPPKSIHYFQTSEDAVKLAKTGKTDSLDHDSLSDDALSELVRNGWHKSVTEITTERFVVLDPSKVNLETRKYLARKLPLNDVNDLPGAEFLRPAYGLIPTGIDGALTKQEFEGTTLSSAYKPLGRLLLHYSNLKPVNRQIAVKLKKMWQTKTFSVDLVELNVDKYFDHLFHKKSVAILGAKGVDYFDGYSVLSYFQSTLPGNFFFVADPSVDALLTKLQGKMAPDVRIQGYKDLQRLILSHHTVIPVSFGSGASGLWSKKVAFVPPHPLGMHTLPMETLLLRKE